MNPLLKIQNNITDEYITVRVNEYAVTYDKAWGSSVKNMEGSTRATLIGILPTIEATTDLLDQRGAEKIGTLLNQGYMMVQYYDTLSGTIQTEPYTASSIQINMIRENSKWYESIEFTLTPVDIQGVVS